MTETTRALLLDVVGVLRAHGCTPAETDAAIFATIGALTDLVDAFEGRAPQPGGHPGAVLPGLGSGAPVPAPGAPAVGSAAPGGGSTPDPLLATAREHFGQALAGGGTPSLRSIQRELHVGHPRARRIRDALTARRRGEVGP